MVNEDESRYDTNVSNTECESENNILDKENLCLSVREYKTKLGNFYDKSIRIEDNQNETEEIKCLMLNKNIPEERDDLKVTLISHDTNNVRCNGIISNKHEDNSNLEVVANDEESECSHSRTEETTNIYSLKNENTEKLDRIKEKGTSKPRIILTLRTTEHDPDEYFSTSSIKLSESYENPVKDELCEEEKLNEDRKLFKNKNGFVTENYINYNKRTSRRVTNSNESVLQNAIALKAKSLRLNENTSCRTSKSPRTRTEKNSQRQKISKSNLFSSDKNSPFSADNIEDDKEPNNSFHCIIPELNDSVMLPNVELEKPSILMTEEYPLSCVTEEEVENSQNINSSVTNKIISRPPPRRKRYFKGLSYSFTRRRNKKRRLQAIQRKMENSLRSSSNTDLKIIKLESIENSDVTDNIEIKTETLLLNLNQPELVDQLQNPSKLQYSSLETIYDQYSEQMPSPSTGEAPEKPACPENTKNSSNKETAEPLCLCQAKEHIYVRETKGNELYCQAVDCLENREIGCCNTVDSSNDIKLHRPSGRLPYLMYCEVHAHRLLIHHCCPVCGLFCTQGQFKMCEKSHLYHSGCDLHINGKKVCPHCGINSSQTDVIIILGEHRNPVFLPFQTAQKELPSARMSFSGSITAMNQDECPSSPIVPSHSFALPSGNTISSYGLSSTAEKDKLEQYLLRMLPVYCSISPAVRLSYRTMYHAAKNGDIEKLLAHIASGLNPNHLYREWVMGTALHAASAGGFICAVHVLVQAGAQIDVLDKDQNTPLMLAALNKHSEVVKYFVKAGANVTFRGKDGMTALHLAARSGNMEACSYLLSNPAIPSQYINSVDDGGWTALVWAAEHRHLDIVLYLLSKHADPLIRDSECNIALHWSAYAGSIDICEALLNYNSDINSTNALGDTPLHICARQDLYSCVVLFLARGARTDLKNNAGLRAIECCIVQPCDSSNAIKLNMQLNECSAKCRERTQRILTNDITNGCELNPIQCVNKIDDEDAPDDFIYITENCFTSNISINRNIASLQSCTCVDSCNNSSCLCAKLSLGCWYTDDGKLSPNFNFLDPPMLFECNAVCKCNKLLCKNRLVQQGMKGHFQLFRTKGRGWGLCSLKMIPQGAYVCEYIGEIISDTEADTRADDSYIFDLDNRDGETYCIDARHYGNIARFINHSCLPNLVPVRIFVNHQDLHFPRIAFFAKRDIPPNEELGYDYGEKFWIIKYKSFTCTCNVQTCRYSKSTIQDTLETYNRKLQIEESISKN